MWIKDDGNEIIESIIKKGMSDYDKAKAIHDWLVNNCEYDWSFSSPYTIFEEGPILYGKGVCQGYAFAFNRLAIFIYKKVSITI